MHTDEENGKCSAPSVQIRKSVVQISKNGLQPDLIRVHTRSPVRRSLGEVGSVVLSSFSLNGKMSFLHVHPVGLIRPACPSWSGGSESVPPWDARLGGG